MLHLLTDRLAELADETPESAPSAAETEHLAGCVSCARELAAFRALLHAAAAERASGSSDATDASLALPLTRWETLAPRLRDEGIIAPRAASAPARHAWARGSGASVTRWAGRVAAALVLVAGGTVAGRLSAGAPVVPASIAARFAESEAVPPDGTRPTGPARAADASLASMTLPTYQTAAEARQAQQRYEALYQNAAAYLAQFDSETPAVGTDAYRVRLAALDRVGRTMREAMREAPYDPVINGYYLTTMGQREVTLRQLNTSLPGDTRLNSF